MGDHNVCLVVSVAIQEKLSLNFLQYSLLSEALLRTLRYIKQHEEQTEN